MWRVFNKYIGADYSVKIEAPDLIVVARDKTYVIRYLIGEEAEYGVEEIEQEKLARYVETYAGILDKLPEGSEIKVFKQNIDLNKVLSRISNEIMNLKASIDTVEEPHVKQRALVKLKILQSLYENILRGRSFSRITLVVKIRSWGRDINTVKQYLDTSASVLINAFRTELGIRVREARGEEIGNIIRYELGLSTKPSLKTIVLDNERIASILSPIPKHKKPVMESGEGIPLGIDLETNWPVLLPLEVLRKHMVVIGPTGRGKSTFLASLVESLVSTTSVNVFGIDFKGDLCKLLDNLVETVSPRDYPINILVKPDFYNNIDWSLAVSDVLSSVLGLNHEALVKVVAKIFSSMDRDLSKILLDPDLSILSPVIDLLMNKPDYGLIDRYMETPHLFNLDGYGTAFQNTYGGLLLHVVKKKLLSRSSSDLYLLIIDEAWRISGLKALQELVKEGRSRGVGVVLSTQNPSDLPREIFENAHILIMFGSVNEDYRKQAQRILGLPNHLLNKLAYLDIGEAILLNALDPHPVFLKIRTPVKLGEKID